MRVFAFILLFGLINPAYADTPLIHEAFEYANNGDWRRVREAAEQSGKPELISLIDWRYMLDDASGAGFDEIIHFLQAHANWPNQSALQQRAEQALRDGGFSDALLLTYFENKDPITGIGKITLAGALARTDSTASERIHRLVHEGWVQGDFDAAMEAYIRENYASILNDEDHEARIDRLLWEKQTAAAERMLPFVSSSRHALYKARMALIQQNKTASQLVSHVPASQSKDEGLLFDRMRYRAQRDDDNGVREMIELVPVSDGYSEKWWPYRNLQAREAIKQGQYKTAAKLVTDYDKLEDSDLAEALWLDGWLALEYNGQPEEALTLFSRMHEVVNYPVSLARAAYWAGRAAEKTGNAEAATQWYRKAALHPTAFYGQMAATQLGESAAQLPSDAMPEEQMPQTLLESAIKLCIEAGEYRTATKLLAHAIAEAENDGDIARLAAIGYHAGVPHISVNAGKKALQKHLILTKLSYPRPEIPADIPIERSLMLAITRQESEFDREAISPSGAVGMMQLLPSSARYIARKIDMPYHRNNLDVVDYNVTLGSHYLARLIDSYDGSYVLAIAAYNAGPGNVNKWVRLFGRPGNTPDDVINWIEQIPFMETRNYVQRVLENLQVYRRLEDPQPYRVAMLEEDLLR